MMKKELIKELLGNKWFKLSVLLTFPIWLIALMIAIFVVFVWGCVNTLCEHLRDLI